MSWWKSSPLPIAVAVAVSLVLLFSGKVAIALEDLPPDQNASRNPRESRELTSAPEDDPGGRLAAESEAVAGQLRRCTRWIALWYLRTEPADRVAWGGLVGCAVFGLGVLFERSIKLRQRRIVPPDFTARFLDRLHDGKLDCGAALDHCELNPSPAARIALAAVRRWGRHPSDLERAVSLAHRVETDRLRRNVGTLRRIAALAPLIGLLGTLFATGRALESIGPALVPSASALESAQPVAPAIALGPALAGALGHLSAGIVIATLALVAFDGLQTRIEKLTAALDRVGAETIDAIAMIAPASPPVVPLRAPPARGFSPESGSHNDGSRRSVPPPHHSHMRRDEGADLSKRYDQQQAGF
jgi:biopolymer transport protein ExbB